MLSTSTFLLTKCLLCNETLRGVFITSAWLERKLNFLYKQQVWCGFFPGGGTEGEKVGRGVRPSSQNPI